MAIKKRFLLYTYSKTKGRGHQGLSVIAGIIIDQEGFRVCEFCTTLSHATKYEAKYVAIIAGIEKAVAHGASHVLAFTDSHLITNQINGISRITKTNLRHYFSLVKSLKTKVKDIQVFTIDPNLNSFAINLVEREIERYYEKK